MNPVVYYRMEEWPKGMDEDTYVLVDSAPGAHHGILHQDRGFGPRQRGRFGCALDLHGPGIDDYALVPDYPKAEDGQLSVSAWVRPWSISENVWMGIVSNWWADPEWKKGTIGQFFLGIDAERALMAQVHDPDGVQVTAREGVKKPFRSGVWHHVAFVADGAMLRLYHNGVEVAATPYRGIPRSARPKALGIGCQLPDLGPGREPGYMGLWPCKIDEVAVFNHPLTAEQMWQLYRGSASVQKPITAKPAARESPKTSAEEKGGSGEQ